MALLKFALPVLGALAFAVPAAAVEVVATDCISVADEDGCLFTGNIAPSTVAETQDDYNLYNDDVPSAQPDIVLNYLGQDDEGFGNLVFGDGSQSFGTWSVPDNYLVDFIAVKAGNFFVLYQLAEAASSGTWDTFDIPFQRNPREVSHLAFFGTQGGDVVPEPATWAMLIAGFGLVGAAMRRRGTVRSISA
jgi:hypothetical protein